MSIAAVNEDLSSLVTNIKNPQAKPLLRSSLGFSLMKLGHSANEVEQALDKFYKGTVH